MTCPARSSTILKGSLKKYLLKNTAILQFYAEITSICAIFLDFDTRLHRIDKAGDPLTKINSTIDWEIFRPILEKVRRKKKKSNAGAKGFDPILLFKILILQSLYNLSDEGLEFQILDRYSFSRFLGLHAASKVPDATTIWRFREELIKAGVVDILFSKFDDFLHEQGQQVNLWAIASAAILILRC